MSGIAIVFLVLGAMVVLLATGIVPAAVAVLGACLALYATGVLDLHQALRGFGDPTVLFIASLLVVSTSLELTGVTAWASQMLLRFAGKSRTRLLAMTMLLGSGFAAMVGSGAATAALMPVAILAAVRLGRSPSQLLMPLAFAAHAGSMLVLTGSLGSLLVSDALGELGEPPLGYLELSILGLLLVAGTVAISTLYGERLVPERRGRAIPEDLSRHSGTLGEQYNLFEGLHALELLPDSTYAGLRRSAVDVDRFDGLHLMAVQDRETGGPLRRALLAAGDVLLVRGTAEAIAKLAAERRLLHRDDDAAATLRATLFNSVAGLAEVLIPPRSPLIGQSVFPGMVTESGDFVILAVQRRGEPTGLGETVLEAGDALLLQGSWEALDGLDADPEVLVVDRPDLVRRQAVPLGRGARRAMVVLVMMVGLLASGAVPSVVAGLVSAIALVLLRVLTMEQAYRAINWTAVIMVAALMPLSTAMYQTGAARLIADTLVGLVGAAGPAALVAALFAITAILGQAISSTATALIVIPIAVASAGALEVSARAALIVVAIAGAASFLTPVAASGNLIVQGPGGYRFTDYWRLGLPLMLWSFLVATLVVPLIWPY